STWPLVCRDITPFPISENCRLLPQKECTMKVVCTCRGFLAAKMQKCVRLRALKLPNLYWKRKRRHDNCPPMRTNNSQDQQRR
ncbi:hypothetical protein LSAT2_009194, partial [Lamellibrachia satsuma]